MATANESPVKFTVYLDPETHKALRIRAIEEGISATKLIEGLIRHYLSRPVRKGGRR